MNTTIFLFALLTTLLGEVWFDTFCVFVCQRTTCPLKRENRLRGGIPERTRGAQGLSASFLGNQVLRKHVGGSIGLHPSPVKTGQELLGRPYF